MKIFDSKQGWGSKVNFIDRNDVFVGFDMTQDCCEEFGWLISEDENAQKEVDFEEIENYFSEYVFDTSFFKEVENTGDFDEGCWAVFKIVAEGKPDLYLTLYNHHNGYYGHGFLAKIGDQTWQEGTL